MSPNLCEIKTKDEDNPAFVSPETVSFVLPVHTGIGVYVYERGVEGGRLIETTLTTGRLIDLLEAASPYAKRELRLIDGLRQIANANHADDPRSRARKTLHYAGVADAEPEKGT